MNYQATPNTSLESLLSFAVLTMLPVNHYLQKNGFEQAKRKFFHVSMTKEKAIFRRDVTL